MASTFPTISSYPITAIGVNQTLNPMAQGADGRIWTSGNGEAAAIVPGGAVTAYASTYIAPVIAALGELFMPAAGHLTAMTTAGVPTYTANSQPYGPYSPCLGPDERIWGTTTGYSAVFAINLSTGVAASYAIGLGNVTSGVVCTDGTYLWIPMNTATPSIVKMSTSGTVIATYNLATGGEAPVGCCIGSDGRLWVCAGTGTAPYGMWAVTLSTGASVWYPTTFTFAGNYSMTLGPDGNVYCADRAKPFIYQITTAGTFTQFDGGDIGGRFSYAFGLGALTDDNGNMWFGYIATSGIIATVIQVSLPPVGSTLMLL